ncbi:MAG: hypothetical protein Q8K61_11160 [Gallionella sp.]|nr:hypothetical protein [Gallionella sp.]
MKKKIVHVAKKSAWIVGVIIIVIGCVVAFFATITNVPTKLEAADNVVFKNFLKIDGLQHPKNFSEEIQAIKTIQHRVFERAPVGAGIPDFEPREPSDLMMRREGLCFDRSRTLDKAFEYIGMPARHAYLLYRTDRGFLNALFHYGQPSHAITEVKTSHGWMFVDSNTEWIALTRDGQVVNADDVWKRTAEFDGMPSYLNDPWWAIRGMYSRKGQLYPPYIVFPDFNWVDFFSWIIKG